MEFRIKALPKYYLHWLPTTCGPAPQKYQQALIFEALLWRAEYRMVLIIWGEEVRVDQIWREERSTKLSDEFRYILSVVLPTWIHLRSTVDVFSLTEITYKFLIVNHTHNNGDFVHATVEWQRKLWWEAKFTF